jgi:hypothetical protein
MPVAKTTSPAAATSAPKAVPVYLVLSLRVKILFIKKHLTGNGEVIN